MKFEMKKVLVFRNIATHAAPRFLGSFAIKTYILLLAGTIGMAAVSEGASATLDAISFNAAAQTITAGTLILDAPLYPGSNGSGTGAGFTTPVTGMLPGDTIHRFVNYVNSGTSSAQLLTMWVSADLSTVLTSNAVVGLKVSVTRCSNPWTWESATATAVCSSSGTTTSLVSSTSLSTMLTESNSKSLNSSAVLAANGGIAYLKFDIQLPDGADERRANAGAPTKINGDPLDAATIQGVSAAITWTIRAGEAVATSDTNA